MLQEIWVRHIIPFPLLSITCRVGAKRYYLLEILHMLIDISIMMSAYVGTHGDDLSNEVPHIRHGFGLQEIMK